MKYLEASHLLPPLLLLSMLLPLHAQDEDDIRRCFDCTERTHSTDCSSEFFTSNTTRFRKCRVGNGPKGIPKGCQILAMQTAEFYRPKKTFIWRDCLYPIDLEVQRTQFRPDRDDPEEKKTWLRAPTRVTIDSALVAEMNKQRNRFGLPTLIRYPWDDRIPTGKNFGLLYYHPNPLPEFWNQSNGLSIQAAAKVAGTDFDLPKPRNVSCFVCTDADSGCEDRLTPTDTKFIQECVGSPNTTVAVGCQILVGQHDYPGKINFYRDCLYEDYIQCHLKPYTEKWFGFVFNLREWLDCLNKVRRYLGLPDHPKGRIPDEDSKPVTALLFKPGERPRGQGRVMKWTNQPDLSNGAPIGDLITQPVPDDYKIDKPFKCFTCDTRQVMSDPHTTYGCDGFANDSSEDWKSPSEKLAPNQLCNPSGEEDAYGCLMLYEEASNPGPTTWVRRDCWYKGYLYCLKGFPMSRSASGRSDENCDKSERKCNAKRLIKEGKRVLWNGSRLFLKREDYEEFRKCVREIRLQQNVKDDLPELPEYGPSWLKQIRYSFCAGQAMCNVKTSPNYVKLPIPTHPPTTVQPTTPGSGGGGGDPCQPEDDLDDDDCECEGDNCLKGKGLRFWILAGVGLALVSGTVVTMIWMYLKDQRNQRMRVLPRFPSQGYAYPEEDPNSPEVNSPTKVEPEAVVQNPA